MADACGRRVSLEGVPSSSCFGVPLEGLSKPTVRKQGQRKEGIVVPDSESGGSLYSQVPNAEKRKSKVTETPAREADSDQERLMMNVLPLSSVLQWPSSSKRPEEHSGVVRVAVGHRSSAISRTSQEAKKMSSIASVVLRSSWNKVLYGIGLLYPARGCWPVRGISLGMWEPGNS